MGKGLATRTIPRLEFVFDEGIGGAVRVNRLLADLAKDRPPQPQPPVDEPPAN
jgi:ribosome-binding factor A